LRVLRSAALLLVPFTVAAVAATAAATTASASQASAEAATAGLSYVAMGSSFAAGPGIPPAESGSPSGCARSSDNYANDVARQIGANLTDVSCSGAVTADILTDDQDGQSPQIDAVGSGTQLVTVTIGGNDIDYLGSLDTYSCQDEGGSNCGTVDTGGIASTLTVLTQRLENVVTAIQARAPQARVLLVDYFTILPDSGACTGVPLTADQLSYEHSLAADLVQDTAGAAGATGAGLVDLATASDQHNACSAQPWVNTYDVASGLSPYHPNAAGMTGAAQLIEQSLAADGATASGIVQSAIDAHCLDVRNSGTTDGTPVQLWGCDNTAAQDWTLVPGAGGTLQALGKCLDVTGSGTADGTLVQLWDCNGTGAQRWIAGADNSLINPESGRCLDDPNSSTTEGAHPRSSTATPPTPRIGPCRPAADHPPVRTPARSGACPFGHPSVRHLPVDRTFC
jgi:lysophospholipase L1-like esterase